MDLKDKVVVVTGSGNGIGEAFARRFTAEGAKVVVTDIEADAVDRTVAAIDGVGLAADMTVEGDVLSVIDFAREAYGEIDVWFSNAGYSGPPEPGVIQADDVWDRTWNLHVMAHVFAARALLPSMLERGDGYLVQTASQVALSTHPEKVAYAATKHAALALSEWLAIQYRPRGVKVSCFCPGPMLTRMLLSNGWPDDHPAMTDAIPPAEIAEIVLRGIEDERFLILAGGGIKDLRAKARDYDQWITDQGAGLP